MGGQIETAEGDLVLLQVKGALQGGEGGRRECCGAEVCWLCCWKFNLRAFTKRIAIARGSTRAAARYRARQEAMPQKPVRTRRPGCGGRGPTSTRAAPGISRGAVAVIMSGVVDWAARGMRGAVKKWRTAHG